MTPSSRRAESADESEVADALLRLFRSVDPVTQEALEGDRAGVSLLQLRALRALRRGPMTMGELASELGSHASSTSRLCDRLEAGGLVERRPDPDDRRALSLVLTAGGRRVVDGVARRRGRAAASAARQVPPSERQQTVAVLDRISSILGSRHD